MFLDFAEPFLFYHFVMLRLEIINELILKK